jgi:hypothetical protein
MQVKPWYHSICDHSSVAVRSYLGFGLMAGRAAVLAWEEAKAANPCVLADHQGAYEYGGMKYELQSHPAGAGFETCSKLVRMVLRQDLECGAPQVRFPVLPAWCECSHSRGHDSIPKEPQETLKGEVFRGRRDGDLTRTKLWHGACMHSRCTGAVLQRDHQPVACCVNNRQPA